ncbi:MAG: carbohydrate ABC transporter permease [Chloroflexota bacterium]
MIESTGSKLLRWFVTYPFLIAGSVVMLFPLAWTFSTSLKTAETVTLREIRLIPDPIMWSNYVSIFIEVPMLRYTINSLIIVIASIFGGLLVCSLAGYAFARVPFPGRNAFFILLLSTMMLPGVVRLIPLFVIFDRLGWVNTFLPLAIPRLLGHDAFYIFLLRQFFRSIPEELSDAARIDGCNDFGIWWRIIIPNSQPVLAAVAIFSFQFAWNDFLSPLIYLGSNQDLWTLALGLNAQKGFEGEIASLHKMMVMSIYMILPVLGIFAVGQQYMIRGVTFSGLKG